MGFFKKKGNLCFVTVSRCYHSFIADCFQVKSSPEKHVDQMVQGLEQRSAYCMQRYNIRCMWTSIIV